MANCSKVPSKFKRNQPCSKIQTSNSETPALPVCMSRSSASTFEITPLVCVASRSSNTNHRSPLRSLHLGVHPDGVRARSLPRDLTICSEETLTFLSMPWTLSRSPLHASLKARQSKCRKNVAARCQHQRVYVAEIMLQEQSLNYRVPPCGPAVQVASVAAAGAHEDLARRHGPARRDAAVRVRLVLHVLLQDQLVEN